MNTPQRPRVDHDTRHVLQHAVANLGLLRRQSADPTTRPDPGDALALLQSLILQADDYLAELAADAHQHGYTPTDQRHFLGLDDPTLWHPDP